MRREKPKTYCEATRRQPKFQDHHDKEHGFPTRDRDRMFEYLTLEIMQAGLSWALIINKRQGLQNAFSHFDVARIAAFDDADVSRLLEDSGIIRSEKKIRATIANAQAILQLEQEHGSFAQWLDSHHPCPIETWIKLFRKTFRFVGPEVIKEYLIGIGYLPDAHEEECPTYKKILTLNPPWLRA